MNIRFGKHEALVLDQYIAIGGPLDGCQCALYQGTLKLIWGCEVTRRVYEYEVNEEGKLMYVEEVKEWLKK